MENPWASNDAQGLVRISRMKRDKRKSVTHVTLFFFLWRRANRNGTGNELIGLINSFPLIYHKYRKDNYFCCRLIKPL
ncbi:hypothetical protein D3C87_02490 [compost metagenome]